MFLCCANVIQKCVSVLCKCYTQMCFLVKRCNHKLALCVLCLLVVVVFLLLIQFTKSFTTTTWLPPSSIWHENIDYLEEQVRQVMVCKIIQWVVLFHHQSTWGWATNLISMIETLKVIEAHHPPVFGRGHITKLSKLEMTEEIIYGAPP